MRSPFVLTSASSIRCRKLIAALLLGFVSGCRQPCHPTRMEQLGVGHEIGTGCPASSVDGSSEAPGLPDPAVTP